jgi:hypothetical protein
LSLILFIRFSVSKRHALLITIISLDKEIINPYSCYIKKGLVYIVLISPSRRQPSFYLKCTKVNTQLFYNIRFIPFNKYIYLYYGPRDTSSINNKTVKIRP